jgi:hypothetical protein
MTCSDPSNTRVAHYQMLYINMGSPVNRNSAGQVSHSRPRSESVDWVKNLLRAYHISRIQTTGFKKQRKPNVQHGGNVHTESSAAR